MSQTNFSRASHTTETKCGADLPPYFKTSWSVGLTATITAASGSGAAVFAAGRCGSRPEERAATAGDSGPRKGAFPGFPNSLSSTATSPPTGIPLLMLPGSPASAGTVAAAKPSSYFDDFA